MKAPYLSRTLLLHALQAVRHNRDTANRTYATTLHNYMIWLFCQGVTEVV